MKNRKGFTLIEMLVCIAIVAALGVAIGLSAKNMFKNSKYSEYKNTMKEVLNSANVYLDLQDVKENECNIFEVSSCNVTIKQLVEKGLLDKEIYTKRIPIYANEVLFQESTVITVTREGGIKKASMSCEIYTVDSDNYNNFEYWETCGKYDNPGGGGDTPTPENQKTLGEFIIDNELSGLNKTATYNMYRFSGAYKTSASAYAGNVDNYICLGTCSSDNLYRIIGVVASDDSATGLKAGMVKVIKNSSIGNYMWDGGTSYDDSNAYVNISNYTSRLTNCDTSQNNIATNDSSVGCYSKFTDTYMFKTILNNMFLNNLPFKDKIASVKWHCYENTDATQISSESTSPICESTPSKISIMYSSDYANSYNNGSTLTSSSYKSWLQYCTDDPNYSSSNRKFVDGCYQWLMTNGMFYYYNNTWYKWSAGSASDTGSMSTSQYFTYDTDYDPNYTSRSYSIRPVFYLSEDVTVMNLSATGSYGNPIRIN